MAVVKSNAYGHGLVRVAHLYEQLGVNSLGVALPGRRDYLTQVWNFATYCSFRGGANGTDSGVAGMGPGIYCSF